MVSSVEVFLRRVVAVQPGPEPGEVGPETVELMDDMLILLRISECSIL